MTFNEYQEETERTRISNRSRQEMITNFALGLAGEAGEVADHIKKVYYHGHKLDEEYITKELGDILWYVASMAQMVGFSLDLVAMDNIDKLKARYPDGFSQERSQNRSEK